MNSRRLIAAPEAWDWRAYEPKVTRLAGKHRSSSGWPMSALGQKQTCALQNVMSALPPKADICQRELHVRFGQYPTSREIIGPYLATWRIVTLKSSCVRK